jgi:hypothetical protein
MKKFLLTFLLCAAAGFGQTTILPKTSVLSNTTMIAGGSAAVTFTHVQGGTTTTNNDVVTCASSGGTGNCTVQNPASGDLLFVWAGPSGTTTISTTGGSTSTWTNACAASSLCGSSGSTTDANGCLLDGGGNYLCAWWATVSSTGSVTATISTFPGSGGLGMMEFHRSSGTWTKDTQAGKVGAFGASCSSTATAAPAAAGELIIGVCETATASETFTAAGTLSTLDTSLANPNVISGGYNLSGTSGAQTATFSMSGSSNNAAIGVVFK